jgi:hypothetical protein
MGFDFSVVVLLERPKNYPKIALMSRKTAAFSPKFKEYLKIDLNRPINEDKSSQQSVVSR